MKRIQCPKCRARKGVVSTGEIIAPGNGRAFRTSGLPYMIELKCAACRHKWRSRSPKAIPLYRATLVDLMAPLEGDALDYFVEEEVKSTGGSAQWIRTLRTEVKS